MKNRADTNVWVRISASERSRLEAAASAAGFRGVSAFLRCVALVYLKNNPGVNINETTSDANFVL